MVLIPLSQHRVAKKEAKLRHEIRHAIDPLSPPQTQYTLAADSVSKDAEDRQALSRNRLIRFLFSRLTMDRQRGDDEPQRCHAVASDGGTKSSSKTICERLDLRSTEGHINALAM